MLVCRSCFNTKVFAQVSARGDARDIEQTAQGVKIRPWDRPDSRSGGLYCPECGEPVPPDPDIELDDDRLSFVSPADFDATAFAEELLGLRSDDTHWSRLELPAQDPQFGDLPAAVHPQLRTALDRTGRLPVFTHQSHAIAAALAGENVVQATPAGSGKSLGFTVPVLNALLESSTATALLVFPLRALVNDQLNALARLSIGDDPWVSASAIDLVLEEGAAPIRIARRDGSTLEHERAEARRSARIVVTTPDTLHESILRMGTRKYRDGTSWEPLLRGLRFVVLDEIHTYQGVFGSNVGQVLRRLRRTAEYHGAHPRFLAASATIGNPVDLAERLTGVAPFTLVEDDGSARRSRIVLVCNPPARDAETAAAAGADGEVGRIAPQTIAIELVCEAALGSDQHDPVRTIGFSRSRNAVFGLSQRIRNRLTEMRRPDLARAVAPYAATFLADDRQEAEQKLRDGSTLAIVSTSALELGIDIPDLSFAVLEGYPGQISSFRQRIGRVGRAGEGVAALIVGDDPLQQYLARNPEALAGLLDARAEDVVINPEAPEIAARFGLAPAQEEFGGIAYEDEAYFGQALVDSWLAQVKGAPAKKLGDRDYFHVDLDGEAYSSLRSATSGKTYTVFKVHKRDREPIGTLDEASAPRDAFVPAIWTGPNGDLYRVIDYRIDPPEILCEGPVDVGYQTRGILVDRVDIHRDHRRPLALGRAAVGYGVLNISRQVVGYREQHFSGAERTKDLERGWPPVEFVTDGLYIEIDPEWVEDDPNRDGTIRAFEHVLLSAVPVVVSCDPYDFDASSDRRTVYLYDSFGGGLRMSESAFDRLPEVLTIGRDIIATCPCASGCPGCVMLNRRPDGNAGLSKAGALRLFERIIESLENAPDDEFEGAETDDLTVTSGGGVASTDVDVIPDGTLINDRFEVRKLLGSGGFSTVYLVWDRNTHQHQALKVFSSSASFEAAQRELSTLRRIPPHPNVVRVFWKDQMPDGQWFIVEEYVEGTLLGALIDRKAIDDAQALSFLRQLLDALIAIHPDQPELEGLTPDTGEGALRHRARLEQSGFVHRDVKPSNIIITDAGVLKLLDFNIASRVGERVRTTSLTSAYMPPDAARSHWDVSPDLFAAGVVLYEMLCGQHPYPNNLPVSDLEPTDPVEYRADLAPPVRAFLTAACAPERDRRFGSAAEMRAALDALAAGD